MIKRTIILTGLVLTAMPLFGAVSKQEVELALGYDASRIPRAVDVIYLKPLPQIYEANSINALDKVKQYVTQEGGKDRVLSSGVQSANNATLSIFSNIIAARKNFQNPAHRETMKRKFESITADLEGAYKKLEKETYFISGKRSARTYLLALIKGLQSLSRFAGNQLTTEAQLKGY